jgi:SRSO17 transposase
LKERIEGETISVEKSVKKRCAVFIKPRIQLSRSLMRDYVRGLLSDARRKNTWQIAEQVGLAIPDGLQRLLYRVPWNADEMCRRLRSKMIVALN